MRGALPVPRCGAYAPLSVLVAHGAPHAAELAKADFQNFLQLVRERAIPVVCLLP